MTTRPQKRQSVQHVRPVQPLRGGGWTEIRGVQSPTISPSNPSTAHSNFPTHGGPSRSGWFRVGQIASENLDDLRARFAIADPATPDPAHTQRDVSPVDGLDGDDNKGRSI